MGFIIIWQQNGGHLLPLEFLMWRSKWVIFLWWRGRALFIIKYYFLQTCCLWNALFTLWQQNGGHLLPLEFLMWMSKWVIFLWWRGRALFIIKYYFLQTCCLWNALFTTCHLKLCIFRNFSFRHWRQVPMLILIINSRYTVGEYCVNEPDCFTVQYFTFILKCTCTTTLIWKIGFVAFVTLSPTPTIFARNRDVRHSINEENFMYAWLIWKSLNILWFKCLKSLEFSFERRKFN